MKELVGCNNKRQTSPAALWKVSSVKGIAAKEHLVGVGCKLNNLLEEQKPAHEKNLGASVAVHGRCQVFRRRLSGAPRATAGPFGEVPKGIHFWSNFPAHHGRPAKMCTDSGYM